VDVVAGTVAGERKNALTGPDEGMRTASPPHVILLIGPQAPPSGGMALQAVQLLELLRADGNRVSFFASNRPFPPVVGFLDRLPAVRTLCRAAMIWAALWKALRDVDVVHVLGASWIYFFSAVVPAAALGRIRGKRVVLNYRGGAAKEFFRHWGWMIAPVFKSASAVTAPSRFLAEVIENRFRIPVQIVPNMIDGSLFRYRYRSSIEPKFLVARNLEKMYDVESALRAFRRIQESRPEASLWIAGSGSEESRLRAAAEEWNLKNVRFLGNVAHARLPEIYDQCDILLNASRVDNFPSTLLEASASGLVVVSTAAGGIPYMYRHGENALLVEPGDWQGLAASVEAILQRSPMARDLIENGRRLAESCQWEAVRKALYGAYTGGEAAAGGRPRHDFGASLTAGSSKGE
jgi:phenylacetate-CoA ligase